MQKAILVAYRCCWLAFLGQLVVGFFVDFPMLWGWLLLLPILVLSLMVERGTSAVSGPPAEPVWTAPPVSGRWVAVNSPATKVPSHGTHLYGQTYAIDVVAEPAERQRPSLGWWPPAYRGQRFPAFGAPLLAVADGTVVTALDRRRDHLSRHSYWGRLYLVVESVCRLVGGAGALVGNHLVLDLGNGVHALYAHLQRGSLTVRPGDRVRTGQVLARCGNSGNSSEPHLHFQLMDSPNPNGAHGMAFSWHGVGVPGVGETFTVEAEVGS